MTTTTERRPTRTRAVDPTVWRLANQAFQFGGDEALVKRLMRGADVLALVEARDGSPHGGRALPLRSWLTGWRVAHDLTSGAAAGSALAAKGPRATIRWSRLRMVSRAVRGRVQSRYMRTSRVRVRGVGAVSVAVVHLPVPSTGQQPAAVAEVRAWVDRQRARGRRWIVLGDVNMDPRDFARRLDARHWHGDVDDVMAAVWSSRLPVTDTEIRRMAGTDHPVLELVVGRDRREYRTGEFGKAPR